ncbi:MAG: hypothetical protein ABEJ65_08615 [bacterium]
MDDRFKKEFYQLRRKIFKFLGNAFHIYDEDENVVLYSEMKGMKLKEDLRIYGSEDMDEELLTITTDQILDIGATYNVEDPQTDERVGFLKRKGMKSMIRDEWQFLDGDENEIALLTEESWFMALASRFINLMPQSYKIEVDGEEIATLKQNFNPFVYKLDIKIDPELSDDKLDRRLILAVAVLLGGVEGKQS